MMENLRKPISENEIEEMIKEADNNHTGYITYNGEYVPILHQCFNLLYLYFFLLNVREYSILSTMHCSVKREILSFTIY